MNYSDKLSSIKGEIKSKYLIITDAYKVSHNSTSSSIEEMAVVVDTFESKQREERKKFYHDISEHLNEPIMMGVDFSDKTLSELSSKMLCVQVKKLSGDSLRSLANKLNIEFINETEFLNEFSKKEFELNL